MYSKENGFKPSLTLVRKLIQKHQKIIDFSENIETLYSNIALMLFISDTLIICFVGFMIVTVNDCDKFYYEKINLIQARIWIKNSANIYTALSSDCLIQACHYYKEICFIF